MSELPTSGTLPAVRLPPACETRWLVELRRLGFGQALAVAETDGNHWNTERLWERAPSGTRRPGGDRDRAR